MSADVNMEMPRKRLPRRMVRELEKFFDARSTEDQLSDLEERASKNGVVTTAAEARLEIISGLALRPREWGAPAGDQAGDAIMLGCHFMRNIRQVVSLTSLVERLGGRYTFLSKEYCCGAPMFSLPFMRGDVAAYTRSLKSSQGFIGQNIEQAGKLGVRRMYHMCNWCVYTSWRLHPGCDIEQGYHLDFVKDLVEKARPALKLETTVGYYEGCKRRKFIYLGESDADLNWPAYRACVEAVKGLKVVDLPSHFCCMQDADKVASAAKSAGVSAVVTPCFSCNSNMRRKAPELRIMTVPELLLEALA